MPVVLDAYDFNGNDIALFDHFFRIIDAAVHQFGYVNQALDWSLQPDEGAKRRQLSYLAGDDLSFAVAGDDLLPALGLGAADAKGDLLAFVIYLQDVDRDIFVDSE